MKALIIVDVQNDFCPGGKLAVPNGDQIIKPINKIIPLFDHVIQTQDWHPLDHLSLASNHPNKSEYETIDLEFGNQVLWPDHCIQGSKGAEFHPDLETKSTQLIIRKGFRREIDSYSAFTENDQITKTGLHGFLNSLDIKKVFICGLATDFCVKWSSLDAVEHGYETYLIIDAVKGIDINNSVEMAFNEMRDAGISFFTSQDLIKEFHA